MSDHCNFPFVVNFIDSDINSKLLQDFKGERNGFVQVGPKKYFFPSKFAIESINYYNTEVRDNDIWIITFPRSGTTLMQEMVWLIGNDLNYKKAANISLLERFPFFQYGLFFDNQVKGEILKENAFSVNNQNFINHISSYGWNTLPKIDFQSVRYIKTHLPFSLLPKDFHKKKCKAIYVARNPKDVIISFYYLNKLMKTQGYQGDFKKYWEYFKQNLQPWTPYWSHIEEGWKHRYDQNILFLFYENIVKDMKTTIEKVANFMNKNITEYEINELVRHLQVGNFKNNYSVNSDILKELKIAEPLEEGFIRNGQINGNKNLLNDELNQEIDDWIKEHLKKNHIQFPA